MKLTLLPLLATLNLVFSTPLGPEMSAKRDFVWQSLTFTFHGGPASYQLTFPADGNTHATGNNMNVNLIDPGSFSALYMCNFYYDLPAGTKTPVLTPSGNGNQIAVGPPATISYVGCAPTGNQGMCLPNYSTCEYCTTNFGCMLLACCSGRCAATKCRPTS